jgi:hypothetical protein
MAEHKGKKSGGKINVLNEKSIFGTPEFLTRWDT